MPNTMSGAMLDAYMDAVRNGHGPYLPLRQVLEEWAAQSGKPPEAVLAALGRAETRGMRLDATYKDRHQGTWPSATLAFFLARAVASKREADRLDGWRVIDELTVSVDNLLLYCRAMHVRPPPCLTDSDGRFAWLGVRLLAPPARDPTAWEIRRFWDLAKERWKEIASLRQAASSSPCTEEAREAAVTPETGAHGEPKPENVIQPARTTPLRPGVKMKDFWPRVLGEVAAWVALNGQPDTQAELERMIMERLEALGESAADSTVRRYARQLRDGYDRQLGGDE
jgi:hypothetical protein